MVNITPAANSGGDQYVSAPADRLESRSRRALRSITSFSRFQQIVSFRTSRKKSPTSAPFALFGPTIPGFGELDFTTYHNVALHDTHAFSPTLINEALASFHRRDQPGGTPENHQTPAQPRIYRNHSGRSGCGGTAELQIIGGINVGNTYEGPQARADNTWQYRDTVSWIKGRHSFKFGAEYRAYEQNQIFDFINNGYLQFTGDFTLGTFGITAPLLPGWRIAIRPLTTSRMVRFLFYRPVQREQAGLS